MSARRPLKFHPLARAIGWLLATGLAFPDRPEKHGDHLASAGGDIPGAKGSEGDAVHGPQSAADLEVRA